MAKKTTKTYSIAAGILIIIDSILLLFQDLIQAKLGVTIPLVLVLLFLALLLAICHLVAPIAPFVYPLF